MTMWHVDFSLAIYNRSGKYVIGRDLLAALSEHVSQVYYWRQPRKAPPRGLAAKVLGNAECLEHRLRSGPFAAVMPDFTSTLPVLHLDPATVLKARLRVEDMVLCHDLGPITHPSLFSPGVSQLYRKAYEKIASVRPRLVFVSQTTKKVFEADYGPATGSHVIYPPTRLEIAKDEATPPVADVGRFILTVGAVGHRKNQAAAIRAFDRSRLAADGVSFVICGGREPGSDEVVELARSTPGIIMLDFVSDAELRWLYAHAIGFVLVSLLEGFGMPIAEAISRGLLPLVSKASVLEEVAGPAALAVDPLDEEDIALGLRKLVGLTASERTDRVRAAQAWIEKFSHEQFVRSWRLALLNGPAPLFRSAADELSCDNAVVNHPLQPI